MWQNCECVCKMWNMCSAMWLWTTKMYLINYNEIVFPHNKYLRRFTSCWPCASFVFARLSLCSDADAFVSLSPATSLLCISAQSIGLRHSRTMQIEWNIQRQFLIHFAQPVQISIINLNSLQWQQPKETPIHIVWVDFISPIEWIEKERILPNLNVIPWRWRWCCISDFIACPYFCPLKGCILIANTSSAVFFSMVVIFSSHSVPHLRWESFIDSYFTVKASKRRKQNHKKITIYEKRERAKEGKDNVKNRFLTFMLIATVWSVIINWTLHWIMIKLCNE